MRSLVIQDMLDSYKVLIDARDRLKDAMANEDLPCFLPDMEHIDQATQRQHLVKAVTRLEYNKNIHSYDEAGLLCASDGTVAIAEAVNVAKEDFFSKVQAVRKELKGEKSSLTVLFDRANAEQELDNEIYDIIRASPMKDIDFLRAYAMIRILPSHLVSIRWTWAMSHSSVKPKTVEDARDEALSLGNEAQREVAIDLLDKLSADEPLATVKPLPAQLRANLVYLKDGDENQVTRKAVTISGVVVCQSSVLPTLKWRPRPIAEEAKPRLKRKDTSIQPEPYIKSLKLHRYL